VLGVYQRFYNFARRAVKTFFTIFTFEAFRKALFACWPTLEKHRHRFRGQWMESRLLYRVRAQEKGDLMTKSPAFGPVKVALSPVNTLNKPKV